MGITRQSTQSPSGYSAQNLQGAQLASRIAGAVSAAVRGNIRVSLQDAAFAYRIHPAETAFGLTDADLTFGFLPGNVVRYGVIGDGVTDNHINLAKAYGVCELGGPAVYFPNATGDYLTTTVHDITGPLYVHGEADRLTNRGPRLVQSSNGIDLFTLFGTGAFSATFRNMAFACGSATAPAGKALFHFNPNAPGPNSFYWYNCWFQTPVFYALNLSGLDDIKVHGCTFDITPERWFAIGTESAGGCTNVSFANNTFADTTNIGMADIGKVDGFSFVGNRCYSNTAPASYGIDMLGSAIGAIKNVNISDNIWHGYNAIAKFGSNCAAVKVADNTAEGFTGPAIAFGGGGTISGVTVVDNILSGSAGAAVGVIDATGTVVTNSIIRDNNITGNIGGTSKYCINLGTVGTVGNKLGDNVMTGFVTADLLVPSYVNNGCHLNGTFVFTLTGVTTVVSGTGRYTVNENAVTLNIPALNGVSNATTATLTGLPALLQTGVLQQFPLVVTDNGANAMGIVQVTNTGALSLFTGVGGAFTAAANKGVQSTAISYVLA